MNGQPDHEGERRRGLPLTWPFGNWHGTGRWPPFGYYSSVRAWRLLALILLWGVVLTGALIAAAVIFG